MNLKMEEPADTDSEVVVKFQPEKKRIRDCYGVDGCFAWLVALMSFLIYTLSGGVCFTGGIILPELLASFPDTDEASATLVVSLTTSMMNFAALCAGCFCEVYGWRSVSIAGSLMVSLGYVCSAFAPSIGILYFTYGILIGVGMAFQFLPCIVIVQSYFTKRRGLATAFVCTGSPIGTFLFAFIVRWLIDLYAWRGALLMMAGILLNAVPFAMFYVPYKDDITKLDVERSENYKQTNTGCSHSLKQLCKSMREVGLTLLKTFKDLKDPKLSLVIVAQFLKAMESAVPYVILPIKLLSLDYSKWQVATLVAVLGAGDFVGRLLVGIQSITCNLNRSLIFATMMFIAGWTEILTGLISDYYWLCGCAFCTAVCSGVIVSTTPTLLVDVMGVERVTRSYGLMCTGQGVGGLIGLPLQAIIYEVSGNINTPFFACSSFPFLSFILMIFVYILQKRSSNDSDKS